MAGVLSQLPLPWIPDGAAGVAESRPAGRGWSRSPAAAGRCGCTA